MIDQHVEVTPGAQQTPIEFRVLLKKPQDFATSSIWRRQRFAALVSGKEKPKSPDEMAQLGHEIQVLKDRKSILDSDSQTPNQIAIRERLSEVEQGLKSVEGKKDEKSYFIRQGLEIRRKILLDRREYLWSTGPLIKTKEYSRWKVEEGHGKPALSPDQWQMLSPRLKDNPDAELNEQQELQWYTRAQTADRQREIQSLLEQMKPIDDNIRAVVCMPAKTEGRNIYRTLLNYVGQTELSSKIQFDYKKLRIVVFDNWLTNESRDATGAQIAKFRQDHPEVQIDYVKGVFDQSSKGIGNIRNIITSAIIENGAANRKSPRGDIIYVSNDADIPEHGINKNYVASIINEFDTNPRMDAMAGKIDFPEKLMSQLPVHLAVRRLWQYTDLIMWRGQVPDRMGRLKPISEEPFLVGRNSAMRLKMIAAVGNYDQTDEYGGEDVEIGNKMKWARSWDKNRKVYDKARRIGGKNHELNRVRYVHHISLDSDARRDLIRLLMRKRIRQQYTNNDFVNDESVRGKSGDKLVQMALEQGFGKFDRGLFEQEVESFFHEWNNWEGGIKILHKALSMLGANGVYKDGKFTLTDTSRLEKNIELHRFRHIYQPKIESYLGVGIKKINILSGGVNNYVYSIITTDGKRLVIRMSNDTDKRNKFATEQWAMQSAGEKGVPTPPVIKVDSGTVLPGWKISITERLPGKPVIENKNLAEPQIVSPVLLNQAGSYLQRIHQVTILNKYGIIRGDRVEGYEDSWATYVLKPFVRSNFDSLVKRGVITQTEIDRALAIGSSKRSLLENAPRNLVHGDFSLGNMLTSDGKNITGILDFENAVSGDPLWDIATFSLYEKEFLGKDGLDALLNGYGQPDLLKDQQTLDRYNLYKLSRILYDLEWQTQQPQDKEDMDWLKDQFKETLQAF